MNKTTEIPVGSLWREAWMDTLASLTTVTQVAVEMWSLHWNKADGEILKAFWQSKARACTDFNSAFLWIWIRAFELIVHFPTTTIVFFKKKPTRESVFPCQMQWSLAFIEVQI